MEDLLPYFQRELVILRRDSREFAERFPKIAGKLQVAGDGCEDPHVERLIQSVALLAARISKRLDDDYPQLTEALFETLFPHYLRPFPACAIARMNYPPAAASRRATVIPRGTSMESTALVQGVRCGFQTACDVTLAPVALAAARFNGMVMAPLNVALPASVGSSLSIVIESMSDEVALAALSAQALRVFIDGESSFCAALRDALLMRTICAHVETADGAWLALPSVPLRAAGFAEQEALIPFGARSHSAYRVLSEYFAFPDKFNFVDLDLAAIARRLPADCRRCTLHLGLASVRADSNAARMLRSLSADNLLLGCVPVVNLFRRAGEPIAVTQLAADYSVLAHPLHPRAYEVYSIDTVRMLRQHNQVPAITEFRPFYALRHGEGAGKKGHYWVTRRDQALSARSPGHERKITLVDNDFRPLEIDKASLSIELSCTNRDLPAMLPYGQTDGDLTPITGGGGYRVRLLRRPTQPCRLTQGKGLHWRLISHLALNHHALVDEGLPAFREMLALYDLAQSPISQRQISGIAGLAHAPSARWMRHPRGASLVHGIEVRLTLDEEAFVGSGLYLFVQVIDQFLGLYVQINSFIELVVLSHKTGEELTRCQPRSGNANLV